MRQGRAGLPLAIDDGAREGVGLLAALVVLDDGEREVDGGAHAAARHDVAVAHDRAGGEDGAVLHELVSAAREAGGALALEQAQASEDGGRGADGGDLLAFLCEAHDGVGERFAECNSIEC